MEAASHCQLSALAELLKPTNNTENEDENQLPRESKQFAVQTPGNIGPVKQENLPSSSKSGKGSSSDIWAAEEVQESSKLDDAFDTRITPRCESPTLIGWQIIHDMKRMVVIGGRDGLLKSSCNYPAFVNCNIVRKQYSYPRYEILFKQKVSSEDIFLGMSGRNPSTACCDELTVKVWLPDTEFSSVHLNVTDTFLDCQTPKYKLGLYFPHAVDNEKGKAQWEAEKGLLTITAPMVREYDFLNKYSTQ